MRYFTFVICLLPTLSFAADLDSYFFQSRREVRRMGAQSIKSSVAQYDLGKSLSSISGNGDEKRYSDLRASFGKALDHQVNGFMQPAAFNSLLLALQTDAQSDYNLIQLGTGRTLVNPQGCLVYSLTGNDSWINRIPSAPLFAGTETAGEMVELYWTALVRDVPFNEFTTNATVASAIIDLNALSNFQGPKVGGNVTTGTFLRGNAPGELDGPYISQFLYQTIPFGATTLAPTLTVPAAGTSNDFLTDFNNWFTVINGGSTGNSIAYDGTPRFIRTPRDLSAYVHSDFPGQAALGAALILLSYGNNALNTANPYLNNPTQSGFVTFGIGEVLTLVGEAVEEGLKAAWFHKWQVNRRCRPEEYGFYLQQQLVNSLSMGINSELTGSQALTEIFNTYGSYFLPQAYPEGCPCHPSYPAGHATQIGAAVTILKALFNEDYVIPNPLEPDASNTSLIASANTLTVGGELNKLASNISLGRDHAGVHYRSDGWQGMLLGELVAIDILNNYAFLYNENFTGYTFTKFDGTQVTVGAKR